MNSAIHRGGGGVVAPSAAPTSIDLDERLDRLEDRLHDLADSVSDCVDALGSALQSLRSMHEWFVQELEGAGSIEPPQTPAA